MTDVQLTMNLLDARFGGKVFKTFSCLGLNASYKAFSQGVLLVNPEKLPEKVGHLYPFLNSLRQELITVDVSPLEECLALTCNNPTINGAVLVAKKE